MVKYNTAASYLDFILTISATADLQKSSEPEPLWAVALGLAGPEVTGKHASPPHQRDAIDDVIDLTRWVSWDEKSAIGLRQVIVTSCENWIRTSYMDSILYIYLYTVYMMFVYVKKEWTGTTMDHKLRLVQSQRLPNCSNSKQRDLLKLFNLASFSRWVNSMCYCGMRIDYDRFPTGNLDESHVDWRMTVS